MGTEQQITERIKELAVATEETIIADRRYFHAHPELSSKEVSTAGTICARLARMGIPYERVAKTGIIATIAGTAAALGFSSMRRRARTACLTVNNIPLTNADIITGVSMMLLFVFSGQVLADLSAWLNGLSVVESANLWFDFEFKLGFVTLLIAHITFDIPYVILSVLPKIRQLDPNLAEAALDLGATPMTAFRKVVLPELMPGIINGALIAFTMSIDDFVISYFTAGSQVSTLSMVVYSMVRRRVSPEINALSTLMFVAVLALLIIINLRQARQEAALARDRRIAGRS